MVAKWYEDDLGREYTIIYRYTCGRCRKVRQVKNALNADQEICRKCRKELLQDPNQLKML